MSTEAINSALERGARFVVFDQVVSALILSFRRHSPIFFVTSEQDVKRYRRRYLWITALFGWWGFPFGLIWTPMSLARTLRGGVDMTHAVVHAAWADAGAPTAPAHTATAPLADLTAPPPAVTPPGWYVDPDDGTRDRYWDGAHWTDQVSSRGQ